MVTIRKSGLRALITAMSMMAAGSAVTTSAQTNSPGERFHAIAMDVERSIASPVDIVVERWSSETDRSRLMMILLDKGAQDLLEALQATPTVGYIKTPESLSWDLHFAWRQPLPEGGERVVIATDRPISFWESVSQPRSLDYPFTVIEMRLDRDGEGTGMLSIATKIIPDKEGRIITLENYGTQRVRLTEVKSEKES
jgi:hypothetical protein